MRAMWTGAGDNLLAYMSGVLFALVPDAPRREEMLETVHGLATAIEDEMMDRALELAADPEEEKP